MFAETKSFKTIFERLERDHGGSGSTEMRSSKKVVQN